MKTTLLLTIALLLTAVGAVADVNLCLYGGVYRCYETDLTCADITIGVIIQGCEDLIANPGGGGGVGSGAVIEDLHPELDGQGVAGPSGGYTGAVAVGSETLVDFTVIFETRDTFAPGRRMQAIARSTSGKLYYAEFDVDFLDPDSDGDTLIGSTRGGEEILGAFDLEPTGEFATGDVTVSVWLIDAATKDLGLEVHHTPIVFGNLAWNFLADGPVGNENQTWGQVKAVY